MKYISTRGYAGKNAKGVSFFEALLDGLGPDGGLYVPTVCPQFDLEQFKNKSFLEVATIIIEPFVSPDISKSELQNLLQNAYKNFSHPAITPLKKLEENHYLLELFHGPTLAFKDVALQLLGLFLDLALEKQHKNLTVLGATSGDTGPAAIQGLSNRAHIKTFMLFPHGRVSDVQRRQMTTAQDENVYPIAIKGTFDDCQKLVKTLFYDADLRKKHHFTAINSISWARILPQMVYYFYAWGQIQRPLTFSVPTGNFGDIFAGYMAKKCGLPIKKLIIATNKNDILTRFIQKGDYSVHGVHATQSPSMDISVASNFERYLFDLLGKNTGHLQSMMEEFAKTGILPLLSAQQMAQAQADFASFSADEAATHIMLKTFWQTHKNLVDPHTAVGLYSTKEYQKEVPQSTVVTLATAHPAKFANAVSAATSQTPTLPQKLEEALKAPERMTVLENDPVALKAFIAMH